MLGLCLQAWSVVLLAYYAAASLTLRTASMLLPNRKVLPMQLGTLC